MLLTAFASGLPLPALADEPVTVAGQRHAEFTLPDLETGRPVSLSDFRDKKVLLIQFASW
jgi:hypothetical protein